jgi:hypothetical protein
VSKDREGGDDERRVRLDGAAGADARLVVRDNNCPRGTVSAVDANAGVAGLQQSADIPLDHSR